MIEILIINSAEPEIKEFVENIANHIPEEEVKYRIVDYAQTPSVNFDNYDGVIISGSPQGDDIVKHHQPHFQWIKIFNKPILGICAGHHITAYMYGAEYLRSIEPESGKNEVQILSDVSLFKGLPNPFTTQQMHNDSVTLPDGFIHLAQSDVCFNQAMKHSEKQLYTLQFHPEYFNPQIIQHFIEICKNEA